MSTRLTKAGHPVSPPTVGRLLRRLDYSLHVNAKKIEASASHPDRTAQFDYIAQQRQAFADAGLPIVSVDTKKKELIGTFKNAGRTWRQEAEAVNVHDFRQDALGRAVPYGVYEVTHNRGTVYVGSSADTAQFAVEALAHWWQATGQPTFPQAEHLLILADGGGSNGWRSRLWKQQLQERVCDELGLTVTVCHYPTGCSKWNPIEHRPFGPYQRDLGGLSAAHLGDHARLHPRHNHHDRSGGRRRTARRLLRQGPACLGCGDGDTQSHRARRLPCLELHPVPSLGWGGAPWSVAAKPGTYCLTSPYTNPFC